VRRVDTGVDTEALSQRMLDEGILIAPGALFHAARAPSMLMRINFATTQDAAFWQVFSRLTDAHSPPARGLTSSPLSAIARRK
jgi:DNA-binding transcriptional MocR family regulator